MIQSCIDLAIQDGSESGGLVSPFVIGAACRCRRGCLRLRGRALMMTRLVELLAGCCPGRSAWTRRNLVGKSLWSLGASLGLKHGGELPTVPPPNEDMQQT